MELFGSVWTFILGTYEPLASLTLYPDALLLLDRVLRILVGLLLPDSVPRIEVCVCWECNWAHNGGGWSRGSFPCNVRTLLFLLFIRLFGGLREDIKRKAPFYISDFKDALHIQCFASFVFLYFACLTPIITFGGLLGDATNNNMVSSFPFYFTNGAVITVYC